MTRVLLVDDEPEMLEAWSFALEFAGYDVDLARNGHQALEAIGTRRPDLVITDLMMPGMGGEDLCRALRESREWSDIPVLLHSSAHIGATTASPRLWDAVLRKPAQMAALLATIEKLTRR
ncbi:response regulator transcription factor [Paraburkholderia sp. SOS3]|jgi:DNA-binding response OmpR family regulator|uniref:response regulator transcription factor n=1 Tax=Paraburkholderia sp. SOS3 TaxID=1926494 RepID=UPI0009477B17|nr:response regulator [Paraburkholderia sp. SOS3]APR38492.1 response regulator [Paraburkholderia sp. SOS3]